MNLLQLEQLANHLEKEIISLRIKGNYYKKKQLSFFLLQINHLINIKRYKEI
jgi:hypothetical protein